LIAARVWKLGDEPLGPEFGEISRQPLLAAGQQVPRGERVGELLEVLGRRA